MQDHMLSRMALYSWSYRLDTLQLEIGVYRAVPMSSILVEIV